MFIKSPKFDRLRAIDDLLRINDKMHKGVISERLRRKGYNASERTVFTDLQDLKDYGAPVRSDNNGYYWYDRDFDLCCGRLDSDDLEKLKTGLEAFKHIANSLKLEGIAPLLTGISDYAKDTDSAAGKVIEFENMSSLENTRLPLLYRAIVDSRALKLTVPSQSYNDNGEMLKLAPYYLKEYRSVWYLIGRVLPGERHWGPFTYHGRDGEILAMSLDQIVDVEITDEAFDSGDFDAQEYFKDIVGVSKPHSYGFIHPINVRVQVSDKGWKWLSAHPLHHSQKRVSERPCVIQYTLIPNDEFYRELLALGDEVEFVTPDKCRRELAAKADSMLYNLQWVRKRCLGGKGWPMLASGGLEDAVYEVVEFVIDDEDAAAAADSDSFRIITKRLGYTSSLDHAETMIARAAEEDTRSYCFHVKKYDLDVSSEPIKEDYGVWWRLYDANGVLIDHTYCSGLLRDQDAVSGVFKGRPEKSLRFKAGDIVEVLDGTEVRLAVVTAVPPTKEQHHEQVQNTGCRVPAMDASDDVVAVIYGSEGHDRVHTLNVMRPHAPLADEVRQRFEGYYKAFLSSKG